MISRHESGHQVAIRDQDSRIAITIDGHELRGVLRAQLTIDHDQPLPVLKLSLGVLTSMSTGLPARIILDKPTRKALLTMGWTPPAEETHDSDE